ncbi:MAG: chloride channel protein [Muribaculaceae bacterium]
MSLPANAPQGSRFDRLVQRLKDCCGEDVFVILIAVVIGLFAGFAAFVLKTMIGYTTNLLTGHLSAGHFNLVLLVYPLAGIVLTGLYQRYVIHRNIEHGVERIEQGLRERRYNLGKKYIYSPMIASTLTLGFGGSAGSEGPIATVGGAIGGSVARRLGLSPETIRVLVGCGAGAGIAGIFKSPIGGVLFTLEVLRLELKTSTVLAQFISCIVSAMTAYVLSGCSYDINFEQTIPFDIHIMPWAMLLGAFCGLYSLYYNRVMSGLRKYFESLRRPIVRNIVSGAMLAVLIFVFPTLYGEGYESLSRLINGHHAILTEAGLFAELGTKPWLLIAITAAILICKPVAACSSNSGGGVAGDFAPCLFAGAIAGFLFGTFLNTAFGLGLPASNMAFVGMAAVMAGVVKAPLMAIFLTAEMADGYQYFLALLVASYISYGIAIYKK